MSAGLAPANHTLAEQNTEASLCPQRLEPQAQKQSACIHDVERTACQMLVFLSHSFACSGIIFKL